MADIALYFADALPDGVEAPSKPGAQKWIFDPSGCGAFAPGYRLYRSLATLCEHVTHGGNVKESLQLIAVRAATDRYPEIYEALQEALRDAFSTREIRFNTVVHRYKLSVDSFVGNLKSLHKYPWLLAAGKPLKDVPVFVVGAGPSLNKNGHLLPECAKRGVIFGLHSSAGAIRLHGAPIDLLCCIEALDTSAFVRHLDGVRASAVCVTAGPANFDTGFQKYIFSPGGNAFADIAERLGGQWLHYGACVSTAAIVLAVALGSTTVVLLGQDLAYTDGLVYARGSGREHVTVRITDTTITRSDVEEQTSRYQAAGLKLSETDRPRVDVPGWHGERVSTTQDMLAFLRWLEIFGEHSPGIRFVNATEGGAHIEHTEESTLEQTLGTLPEIQHTFAESLAALSPTPEARVRSVISGLRSGAAALKNKCNMALSARPHQFPQYLDQVNALLGKNQLVYELAHPQTSVLEVSDLLEHKKGRPFVRIIKGSCEELISALAD